MLHQTTTAHTKVWTTGFHAERGSAMDLFNPSDLVRRLASKGVHANTLGRQRTLYKNHFPLATCDTAGFKVERIDLQHI
jgi:hypothetical protein